MSPSASVAAAVKATSSGAVPDVLDAVVAPITGLVLAGATPQAAEASLPAAISMPAAMCERMPASL